MATKPPLFFLRPSRHYKQRPRSSHVCARRVGNGTDEHTVQPSSELLAPDHRLSRDAFAAPVRSSRCIHPHTNKQTVNCARVNSRQQWPDAASYHLLAYTTRDNQILIRVLAHPRVLEDIIQVSLISCHSHVASLTPQVDVLSPHVVIRRMPV
jgi:hypothetical protein